MPADIDSASPATDYRYPSCGSQRTPAICKPRPLSIAWWDDPSQYLGCPDCGHFVSSNIVRIRGDVNIIGEAEEARYEHARKQRESVYRQSWTDEELIRAVATARDDLLDQDDPTLGALDDRERAAMVEYVIGAAMRGVLLTEHGAMTLVEEPDRCFDVLVHGHSGDLAPVEFRVRFKATTRPINHLDLQREREIAAQLSHPLTVLVVHDLDIERSHHELRSIRT